MNNDIVGLVTDPRLYDPKMEKTAVAALKKQAYEKAFDHASAQIAELEGVQKQLPSLTARLDALEERGTDINVRTTLAPPATVAKAEPKPDILKCLAVSVAAEFLRVAKQKPVADTIKTLFPDQPASRRIAYSIHSKTGTSTATTTAAGWGAELVQSDVLSYWSKLAPISVAGALITRGIVNPIQFGTNGSITVPMRGATNDGAMRPAWVRARHLPEVIGTKTIPPGLEGLGVMAGANSSNWLPCRFFGSTSSVTAKPLIVSKDTG